MKCSYIGKVVDTPTLTEQNNTKRVDFALTIENYRRNRLGEKIRDLESFSFVAFDSGAENIATRCKKGDLMWFDARPIMDEDLGVVFRVERFKVVKPLTKDDSI